MTNHDSPHAGDVPLPGGRMTSGILRRGDWLLRRALPLHVASEILGHASIVITKDVYGI
jgi:integrase